MTRTARAAHPRALNRDRSESRTGLDSSIRKSGAGNHNWGSLADECYTERVAIDESLEERETLVSPIDSNSSTRSVSPQRQLGIFTDKEMQEALDFRKNAFKAGEIDLTAIARTSSAVLASASPPQSPIVAHRSGQDNKQIQVTV